jgi:hypothetical protein
MAAEAPPAKDPTNDAVKEAANTKETLHTAAKFGSLDSVNMLLRSKADPSAKDSEGMTALQAALAVAASGRDAPVRNEIALVLKEAMGMDDATFEANQKQVAQFVRESSTPAVQLDTSGPQDMSRSDGFVNNQRGSPSSPAKSPGGGEDLKARTMFSQSTTDGVLKRTTFIHKLSNYHSAPEITIASRTEGMFTRSQQGPSPGSYNLPHDEKSKFKTVPRYSFGGSSRFGLGASPSKQQPGPGAYNPRDPALLVDTKVGFGTSVRNKGVPSSQANPGPGAYESRNTVGGGLMFTAMGRHPTSYMRSRSLPGPGAYTPTLTGAYQTSPKCGFGTSTRGDFTGGNSRGQPGPGTYEMQNWKRVGSDSSKFSATSRRKMHDLNSYVTPGPGTYNAHATSFGSPGAYSCRHVDEGYTARNAPAH